MKALILAAATLALLAGCATPRPAAHGMQHTAMEQHMQAMQGMREKLAAAPTPQERERLMQEQMELMHRGMDMLSDLRGEGADAHAHGPMEMRMQMMQSMMQMMMDRMDPMHR
jgi:hypothetical protein